jgi:DNA primase
MFREEDIAQLKQGLDIAEVVNQYFPMRRKGVNLWACCPFHEEKTPSFSVNPERQVFKCFGCGKSGSVFDFVMDYEKIDFPEAVRKLAGHAGIEVRQTDPRAEERYSKKKTLEGITEWAAKVFRQALLTHPDGEKARSYLFGDRCFTEETLDSWRIGYAPESWDFLLSRARRAGYSDQDVEQAGLVVKKEGSANPYDRFRGRVIFPIQDAQGKYVGFAARTLIEKDEHGEKIAKYINTPETQLYQKRRILYGMHRAKRSGEKEAFLVEGYTDVMMASQFGIENAVAICGNELTHEQSVLLKKHFDKVINTLDPDLGGEARVPDIARQQMNIGMRVHVLQLPENKDPDVVLLQEGRDSFLKRAAEAGTLYDFVLEKALRGKDVAKLTPDDQREVLKGLMPFFDYTDGILQERLYLHETARRMGLDYKVLLAARAQYQKQRQVSLASPSHQAEFNALAVMLRTGYRNLFQEGLTPGHFTDPVHRAVFGYFVNTHGTATLMDEPIMPASPSLFGKQLDPEEIVRYCKETGSPAQPSQIYALLSRIRDVPVDNFYPNSALRRVRIAQSERELRDLEQGILAEKDDAVRLEAFERYCRDYAQLKGVSVLQRAPPDT